MANRSGIKEHMEVIGADGVHVGTVDKLEGDRIKLTKRDDGQGGREGRHRYLSVGLVATVEGDKVRLSANAANAFMFEEGSGGATGGGKRKDAGPDWTTIGLGAAAVGAVAGAALLARRGVRGDGSGIGLQTDESVRLISSSKVEGTPVVGRDGEHLGKIDSFMVDKYSGRVAYAVMSFGGTLGFGEHLFPLPWSFLNYDEAKDGYSLNVTTEQLANAPKFKRSEAPEFGADYRRDVTRFYGRPGM